jgi:outer membrane receptor protein involved in Fe transport
LAQTTVEPLTLPSLGTPIQDVPANVQIYGSEDLRHQRGSHLADFPESNATSVSVNAAQGNSFQPDVSFRGFIASPLLGLPQGLSVFQDGVRVNEPFGDVVNWDLIPQSAIASLQLLPGSHPGPVHTSLRYGLVDATYQSSFTMNSPANSSADAAGNIKVSPGNQVPGLPRQTLKLRLGYDIGTGGSLGVAIDSSTGQYARGNENNQSANGWVAGFTVVNIDADWQLSRSLEVSTQVGNLFDRRYHNFGSLGRNVFTGPNNTFDGLNPRDEVFLGFGAPRGAWIGLRYNWL